MQKKLETNFSINKLSFLKEGLPSSDVPIIDNNRLTNR